MKASEELIEKIKEFEGYSNTAYRCAAGVWTCGWGHVRGVTATTTCVKSEAERWLKEDLAPVEAYVGTIEQVRTQGQFDALVDFAYNLGVGNLKGSTLLRKIKAARRRRRYMRSSAVGCTPEARCSKGLSGAGSGKRNAGRNNTGGGARRELP